MIYIKKNKIVIIPIVIVLLISLGIGSYFIISDNKKEYKIEISEQKISEQLKYNEITYEADTKYSDKTKNTTVYNSNGELQGYSTKRSDLINDIAKQEIAKVEAKKNNVLLGIDKITALYEERINSIKSDENYYNGLKKILSEKGVSEEEYFRIAKDISYGYFNNLAFQNYYEKNSEKTVYEPYNDYIDSLVKKSKVKITK